MPSAIDIISVIFALLAVIGLVGGLINRQAGANPKGIGTQFIRYTALVVALPIAATLTMQGMQVEALVAVIMGALGYTFAGLGE